MEIKLNKKKNKCQIILEPKEELYILSKNDKAYFLQVSVDEYDDIIFLKRQNFKTIRR